MANSILAQSRIQNEIFYDFEFGGALAKYVTWKSDDFKASANVGGTYQYRRPGKSQTFATALAARGVVPTVGSAPAYGNYTEPVFPMAVTRKFRQAVVVSSQDLSLSVTPSQIVERLKAKTVVLRHQIEQYMAGLLLAGSSSVIGTPGTASTGATLLSNFTKASGLITSRGVVDSGNRVAFIPNIQVGPNVLDAYRGLYNPQSNIAKAFTGGAEFLGRFSNIDMISSPYLPTDAVAITGTPALTVSGAYQNAGAVWTPTWTLNVTGGAGLSGLVIPAGTLFTLSNSGTVINWVVTDVFTNTGVAASFRTLTSVTLDASGNGALVVTEPLIADTTDGTATTNGYQNVTANAANGATLGLINDVAAAYPSIVFDPAALIGVSVPVQMPKSIYVKNMEIDGINLALIETADPLNGSAIYEVQALVGFAVGLPEAVVSVY